MVQTTQNTNSMPLPAELILLIIKRLRKPDLKKIRLVCRSLRLLAIPLLFDQIAFSPSVRALNMANLMAFHFGCHVKTLFYFPVKYRYLTLDEFSRFSQKICGDDVIEGCIRLDDEDGHTDIQCLQQHIEHSFRSYCSRAREQWEMDQTGAHLAHLCYILSKIPRAQKLVIGATGSCNRIRIKDMRHLGIRLTDLCPRKGCIISPGEHVNMQPAPHCFWAPDIRDFFHPAMLALHSTGSAITKLDIQVHKPKDDSSALLAVSAFNTTIPQSRYMMIRLSMMTKLRFDLGIDTRSTDDEEVFNRRNVARALATARNLECLYISLTYDFEDLLQDPGALSTFDGVLGGCQFPKLKSLVLECFNVDQAELLDFLKPSAKLEALCMHDIHLSSGSWGKTVEELRLILRLKEVVLSGLRHNDWAGFTYELTKSCVGEVEEFFLRQGENPFTALAIGRKRALYGQVRPLDSGFALGHWSLERHWRRAMS